MMTDQLELRSLDLEACGMSVCVYFCDVGGWNVRPVASFMGS